MLPPIYSSEKLQCDGKKKAWEILGEKKDIYVLETPHKKSKAVREHYLKELKALIKFLEEKFGKELTAENLKAAMEKIEAKRDAIARIYKARQADPVPISGEGCTINFPGGFYADPDRKF